MSSICVTSLTARTWRSTTAAIRSIVAAVRRRASRGRNRLISQTVNPQSRVVFQLQSMQKHELQDDELDSRAREVLREIIVQHVATGEAISSRSLARCGRFQLSPASLRNVMADLEDLGYLQHPHTSAGRIPTDRGYRFFIDHLMRSRALSMRDREAIDSEVRNANEIDEV